MHVKQPMKKGEYDKCPVSSIVCCLTVLKGKRLITKPYFIVTLLDLVIWLTEVN